MPKILIAALSLAGLLVIAALTTTSGRAEPALTRADSVLPPPLGTFVLLEHGPRPLHPLGLLRLAAPSRRGRRRG